MVAWRGERAVCTDEVRSLDEAETSFQKLLAANDVAGLDRLLDRDVHFVGPDGKTISKDEDLAAHRSGEVLISDVRELRREVQVIDGVGITRVALHLLGIASGRPIAADLIYTRVWRATESGWVVIAAHGSAL
jgi:hypothetical protein